MDNLSDELQEMIAGVYCFTAAQGTLGYMTQHNRTSEIDPRLHNIVVAVVMLRNGESFVGTVTCRPGHPESFQSASQRAKSEAFRKVKDHLRQDLVGTLV